MEALETRKHNKNTTTKQQMRTLTCTDTCPLQPEEVLSYSHILPALPFLLFTFSLFSLHHRVFVVRCSLSPPFYLIALVSALRLKKKSTWPLLDLRLDMVLSVWHAPNPIVKKQK